MNRGHKCISEFERQNLNKVIQNDHADDQDGVGEHLACVTALSETIINVWTKLEEPLNRGTTILKTQVQNKGFLKVKTLLEIGMCPCRSFALMLCLVVCRILLTDVSDEILRIIWVGSKGAKLFYEEDFLMHGRFHGSEEGEIEA